MARRIGNSKAGWVLVLLAPYGLHVAFDGKLGRCLCNERD